MGRYAGIALTTGDSNTCIGSFAGDALTTASLGTALGESAGSGITTGGGNTCIGAQSANNDTVLTTGTNNTCLGVYAHTSAVDSVKAISIGYNVSGEGGYTTLGEGTSDIRAVHGTASWAAVSDERVKKDIEDSTVGLAFINELRPVTFNYRNKGDIPEEFTGYEKDSTESYKYSTTNHGFIAQEVKEVIDNHIDIADGFKLWDVRDTGQQEVAEVSLIPMLTKAVQELSAKVEELETKLNKEK
jgi:hypothetical protein